MLNVLSAKVVAGALSLGILAPAAYTATTQDTADQSQVEEKQQLDEETKSKLGTSRARWRMGPSRGLRRKKSSMSWGSVLLGEWSSCCRCPFGG
ncbi:hypothetical protein ACPJHQ_23195 [Rossellomorea sp. H39__3]